MSGRNKNYYAMDGEGPSYLSIFNTVFVALVAIGLGVGFGVGFGNRIHALERENAASKVSNAEFAFVVETLATGSITPASTSLESGTFDWAFMGPSGYTIVNGSAYDLRQVTLGPLTYTTLTLDTPSSAHTLDGARFMLNNFEPALPAAYTGAIGGNQIFPLTPANLARVDLACIAGSTCTVRANAGAPPSTLELNANNIKGEISPASNGNAFSLSASWVLLLPFE